VQICVKAFFWGWRSSEFPFKWINQPEAAIAQVYCLSFKYSSTYLYSFTVHVVVVHCLKTQHMHYALKYTLKTHSLFKTLECLRLLCHPTCFGHTLDHLQRIFLVQCCFPPCCFVTVLLGYVALSSICVVVLCTSLLSVFLCTQQDWQQRGTHDNNTDRRYGHIPQ